MTLFRIAAHVLGLMVILIFYVLPSFMIPFVGELPYLHGLTIWRRLQISFVIFGLSYFLIFIFSKSENRKLAFELTKGLKNTCLKWCGLFLFVYGGGAYSANILGLLVMHTFQNYPCTYKVDVLKMDYQGTRAKSIFLNLKTENDGKVYYLTLSKKMFDYPEIKAGDKMILNGKQNIFGVYIENFKLL